MRKCIIVLLLAALLVSCSPSESAIQTPVAQTVAAIPTQTAYPTYTLLPTMTAIVITATPVPFTPTPEPTKAPTSTFTPKPTEDPFRTADKVEGVWLVDIEVAPGNWRAVGGDCYAVLYDKFNEQLDMTSGVGMIIYVPRSAYKVEFISYPGNCTWTYLGP